MKPGVAARREAAALLARITDDGAHSNVLLDRDLAVPAGQRPTTHRLVMDTLRQLPWADHVLAGASRIAVTDLDRDVRAALRVGITELLLGGDPHGVVDSTVEVVRSLGAGRAAGFTNAVLRTVAGAPHEPPDPATGLGVPGWIRDRLVEQWSPSEADAFLAASLLPAPIAVRQRPGGTPPPGEPLPGIAGAWVVPSRDAAAGSPVMDAASTAVASALGAEPGHRVLDVAAAPGNKTLAIADAMTGSGTLVATDRSRRRVVTARKRLVTSGADHVGWVIADGSQPPFAPATFDRILVDAPCTGLGTVRRRPEIKLRLDEGSPDRMAALQRGLLAASVPLLRARRSAGLLGVHRLRRGDRRHRRRVRGSTARGAAGTGVGEWSAARSPPDRHRRHVHHPDRRPAFVTGRRFR